MDVATMVTRAARRFGDRTAVTGPDAWSSESVLSFAALGERVTRIAAGLRELGLRPGDRVLDLQANTTTYLETDLAVRAAGLVRVALNHRLHPDDWERIAADCDASALIYDARFAPPASDLCDAIGANRVIVAGRAVGGEEPGSDYRRLLDHGGARLIAPDADALCGLHYSSGTTGRPKGAQRTHRNWLAGTVNMTHDVLGGPPGPDDVYGHAGPITHTSGLFVLPFLIAGARQVIMPTWDPERFADAVVNQGVTHSALVPTMIARLLSLDDTRLRPVRDRLRMLGYAGAPMAPEQIRAAHDRITTRLVQYYGLVEAIPPVTVLDADDHARGLDSSPELLTSAGHPALGVELRIVDGDGHEVPTGDVGEVVTRGDHVMPGYYNSAGRPAASTEKRASASPLAASTEQHSSAGSPTASTEKHASAGLSKAVINGWLHTGDLGRVDEAGRLWLVDRKGDMIITGGYNVYPREVEDVVAEVAGVREVAVVGVADPDWGQRVVAVYTGDADVDQQQVVEHCRSRLASYKKPKQAIRVDSFPLNSTQKIDKRALRERLEAGSWNG